MEIGIFSRTYEHMTLDAIFAQMVQAGIHHTQFNLSSAGMDTLPETMDEEKLQNVPGSIRLPWTRFPEPST